MTGTKGMTAVILAAGSSSRMGRFKPLLELGGTTIVERVVSLFRGAGILDIRVVAGHGSEVLERVLRRLDVQVMVNERYEDGMFSSVLRALRDMGPGTGAVFILPVDIPLVSTGTMQYLVMRHCQDPARILIPSYHGRRGHPVVIPGMYLDAVRAWSGERGLRGALEMFSSETVEVSVEDRNILFDLDTPADYEECLRRWSAMSQEDGRIHVMEVPGT